MEETCIGNDVTLETEIGRTRIQGVVVEEHDIGRIVTKSGRIYNPLSKLEDCHEGHTISKADAIRFGKQVVTIISDDDDDGLVPHVRHTIHIRSSDDDHVAVRNFVKVEEGGSTMGSSFSWDHKAEAALREMERTFEGPKGRPMTMEQVEEFMGRSVPRVGDPRDTGKEFPEGEMYDMKAEIQERLRWEALRGCFETIVKRSTKSVYVVVCPDPSCNWMCRASRFWNMSRWMIHKLVDQHTCKVHVMSKYQRQTTYKLMGQSIVSNFSGTRNELVPGQIKSLMRSRLGVDCSYWKARRARDSARDALYDTDKENYHRMSSYLYMLEQANPDTLTTLELDENHQFKYAFVSLGV